MTKNTGTSVKVSISSGTKTATIISGITFMQDWTRPQDGWIVHAANGLSYQMDASIGKGSSVSVVNVITPTGIVKGGMSSGGYTRMLDGTRPQDGWVVIAPNGTAYQMDASIGKGLSLLSGFKRSVDVMANASPLQTYFGVPQDFEDFYLLQSMFTMRDYVDGKNVSGSMDWTVCYMAAYAWLYEGYAIDSYNQYRVEGNSRDYDRFDTEILAWCYYWNYNLRLSGDSALLPNLVKAMMAAESDIGITSKLDPMQVFGAGNPAMYTLARVGNEYQHPNDWRIPAEGYGAVRNLFTDGKPDVTKTDPRLSIAFGTRWLGHNIQNESGDRASGVSKYNGWGHNDKHGIPRANGDGYLKYVRAVMDNPNGYIHNEISKVLK